jgi:hypothetical protein
MDEHLININNHHYYLDIDAISEFIKVSREDIANYKKLAKNIDEEFNPSTTINLTKYEMTKMMVEVVFNMGFSMEDTSDMDDTEKLIKGVREDDFTLMPTPFKIAFNTLIINKIIKTHEPTNRKNKRSDSETKK